jgi:hypothetical protein
VLVAILSRPSSCIPSWLVDYCAALLFGLASFRQFTFYSFARGQAARLQDSRYRARRPKQASSFSNKSNICRINNETKARMNNKRMILTSPIGVRDGE